MNSHSSNIYAVDSSPSTVLAGSIWGRRTFNRPICLVAIALVLLFMQIAFEARPAGAAIGHAPDATITEAPPGTHLGELEAVAVDRSDGDLFAADLTSGTVDVFDSAGSYLGQFGERLRPVGVAVDEARGLLYVANSYEDAVNVYKPVGGGKYTLLCEWTGADTPEGEFGEVAGVAVDNSTSPSDPHAGDVYVVNSFNNAVYVFTPHPEGTEEASEGVYVSALSSGKLEEPNGVAVNSGNGKVYVADGLKGMVAIYSSSGAYEGKLTGKGSPQGTFLGREEEEGNVAGVAVDPASGEIYVAEAQRHVVSEFDAEGQWVGWIPGPASGSFGEPRAVALTAGADPVVADAAHGAVNVFGPDALVPDAVTNAASKVGKTTATLGGVIDGDGKPAKYQFQWGTSEALGEQTSPQSAGTGEEKVAGALTELKAATTYYYRLVAENENGVNYGAIREVTTEAAVASLATGPVANIAQTSAKLTGGLTPAGFETQYHFQWGPTISYGQTTPWVNAGSGASPVNAEATIAGLTPNMSYHYRLIGENSLGVTVGQDRTFTTAGPPRITGEPTGALTHEGATLNAKVDPDQIATTYRFEYGPTIGYGYEAPAGGASVGSGNEPVAVSAVLSGLRIGTVYHFRVVAENSDSEQTIGPDGTFETVPAAPIEAEYTTEVGASAATLNTAVNPLGDDTSVYFQYGPASCSEQPAACTDTPLPPGEDIGAGEQDVQRSSHLEGLEPDTTYHYRVIATNALGSTASIAQTFTTKRQESSFTLPDGRTWEMVSPSDKQGAPVEALTYEGGMIRAAQDGDALAYVVDGALGEGAQGNRSPEPQQILAERGEREWSSQDIATANRQAAGINAERSPEYELFNESLSEALVEPVGPPPEPPLAPGVTQTTFYLRDSADGAYLPVVSEGDVAPGAEFSRNVHFVDATPDLSHVVLSSTVALLGPTSSHGLYEWSAGELQQVSILPDGALASGTLTLGYSNDMTNAISSDGTRILWTVIEETPKLGHLYMRDTTTRQTVQLDAAQGVAEPSGSGTAEFQGASADGSKVFFTDRQRLTPEASADPVEPRARHLRVRHRRRSRKGQMRAH